MPFHPLLLGDSVRCADPILYAFNVRSDMAKEMNVPFTECVHAEALFTAFLHPVEIYVWGLCTGLLG